MLIKMCTLMKNNKGEGNLRPLTNNSLLLLEKTMDGLWTRQTAILENIAHSETPNYKTKYVTFEETLKASLDRSFDDARPASAVRAAILGSQAVTHEAQESTRMDGNGVNITEQNLELVRTEYALQYVMQAISGKLTTLRSVIKGQ